MAGMCKAILVGNIGNDIEVRYTQGGVAVTNLRVACTDKVKDGDGYKDRTFWADVVVFDKTAETIGQHLSKGSQVYVEGRLQTREYTDKDGNPRKATEIVASQVLFLGSRPGASDGPTTKRSAPKSTNEPARVRGDLPETNGAAKPTTSENGFVEEPLPF